MRRVLLFAGTTEGRMLAERLVGLPVEVTISVATEYGREALTGLPERFRVLIGRLDAPAMLDLMRYKDVDTVVDATHPYAALVSENIREAAKHARVNYLRLLRSESARRDCVYVPSVAEAAKGMAKTEGNILLATGSKELAGYVGVPDFAERMYPRVLPTVEAIRQCEELGFRRGHIIAMQGPFNRELNRALMEQYDIRVMATKDGGAPGGFPEKMLAAEDMGVTVFVIGRPPEEGGGYDLDEVVRIIGSGEGCE